MNYSVVYGRVGRRAFLFRVLMCQNKWAEVVLTGHNEMTEINGIGREKRERTYTLTRHRAYKAVYSL
jgi:hypothetical protein